MNSTPMKKQKVHDENPNHFKDKLSELPDQILVHILSLLPIKDAVRTVLLRRFGNLWTLIPKLEFDKTNDEQFVCNVMKYHNNPTIDKFELLNVDKISQENFINFINFALKKAKVLSIRNDDFIFTRPYDLPRDTFRSRCIVSLHLYNVEIKFPGEVEMRSLRKLELAYVTMNHDTFRKITFGCPCLKELVIKLPHILNKLHFSAPNIERLEVEFDHEATIREEGIYTLDCPKLKILHVKGICLERLELIDVSSVRHAYINRCSDCHKDHGDFDKLLSKFRSVEFFQLDDEDGAYMQLDHCGNEELYFRAPTWFYLVLRSGIHGSCLVDIIRLLRSACLLVEVTIYADVDLVCVCDTLMHELCSPCVLPMLQNFRYFIIREYKKPCEALFQLIEFVLKNAAELEQMVIVFNGKDELYSAVAQEFILQLLSFPRASPTAKVEIQVMFSN